MKTYKIIKTIIYLIAGILVLIFNEPIMEYLAFVVGAAVLAYGLDGIIKGIIKKELFGENSLLFALVNILIGIALFLVHDTLISICIIWAVWSILREGVELTECLHKIMHKKVGFINMIESIVVIVFSFTMILNPSHHHAHTHVIILGIELMLEVLFPHIEFFASKYILKHTN